MHRQSGEGLATEDNGMWHGVVTSKSLKMNETIYITGIASGAADPSGKIELVLGRPCG